MSKPMLPNTVRIGFYNADKVLQVRYNLNNIRIRLFTKTRANPPGVLIEEISGFRHFELWVSKEWEILLEIKILPVGFEINGIVYNGFVQVFSDELSQQLNMQDEALIIIESGHQPSTQQN